MSSQKSPNTSPCWARNGTYFLNSSEKSYYETSSVQCGTPQQSANETQSGFVDAIRGGGLYCALQADIY